MPVESPFVLGKTVLDLDLLPFEWTTAKTATTDRLVKPVSWSSELLAANENSIVLATELVCDGRVFFVDQIGVVVLEFELVVHVWDQLQIYKTRI